MSLYDEICTCAVSLEGAWRDPAWDIEGAVFKTADGRIFAICAGDDTAPAVTLKLPADDAQAALTLPFVKEAAWPAGWLTARPAVDAERDIVLQWVVQSYALVSSTRARTRGPAARG